MAGFLDRFKGILGGGPDKAKMRASAEAWTRFDKAKTGVDTILGQVGKGQDFRNLREDVTNKVLADNARRNGTEPQKKHPYQGRGFNDISNLPVSSLHAHRDGLIEDFAHMRTAARDVTAENLKAGFEAAELEFQAYLGDEKGKQAFATYSNFISRSDAAKTMRYFEMERDYKLIMGNSQMALRRGNKPGDRSMLESAEERIAENMTANKAELAEMLDVNPDDKKLAPLLDKYAEPNKMMELAAYNPHKGDMVANKVDFARQHGQMIDVAMRELATASPDDSRGLYDVVKARMGQSFEPTPEQAPERDPGADRSR
ncbi:MAG: hypothetical protein GC134_05265 [Proteobacteria bacterium]|nr:hypothetical protein [Pseudomonadota bacterium]